ncbi:hypothetical protein PMIN02_004691 [Paraphaeosphaeria minitans]
MPPTRENDVAPPPYSSHPAPTPAADTHVGIGCEWGDAINAELPTATQCATHLKLLHSLARLRKEVGCCEGLYGISFEGGTVGGAAEAGTLAERVREKRWSVFVARAVDRFERWWERLLEGCGAWNAKLQTSYFDGARSGEAKEVSPPSGAECIGLFFSFLLSSLGKGEDVFLAQLGFTYTSLA